MKSALPRLLRYGHALTGNPHDAADLVQSVLERVGARWSDVQCNDDPLPYIRRSMANAHISRWRRTRREHLVADVPGDRVFAPADPFDHELLWLGLRALPARQRAVLVLRYCEGLSEREIAQTLSITTGTVKSHAARAIATLRTKLTLAGWEAGAA